VRALHSAGSLLSLRGHPEGHRPSFADAAPPELAEPLYECFCATLRAHGVQVATGAFGASVDVGLVNNGPVTIVLDAD
jgi:D-tyrosyl-tRNA(Tyr) deacylase